MYQFTIYDVEYHKYITIFSHDRELHDRSNEKTIQNIIQYNHIWFNRTLVIPPHPYSTPPHLRFSATFQETRVCVFRCMHRIINAYVNIYMFFTRMKKTKRISLENALYFLQPRFYLHFSRRPSTTPRNSWTVTATASPAEGKTIGFLSTCRNAAQLTMQEIVERACMDVFAVIRFITVCCIQLFNINSTETCFLSDLWMKMFQIGLLRHVG